MTALSRSPSFRVRLRDKATGQYLAPSASAAEPAATDYEAAGTGRRATTWRTTAAGPNASLSYALPTLINRSRDAVRKNPYADRAVSVVETNVVGTGIKPQFATPDAALNAELERLWLAWTDECDADGRLDFYGLQALAVRAMVEAGEVFGRFRLRQRSDMETVPLQVQLLESEFCPTSETRLVPGREIRNGIEFDMVGRRTAYWMYRQHPNDARSILVDGETHPVPASEIMHVYELRRPGATRGEPWLTRALIKLRDLDGFDDATLVRAKVAKLIAGFITSPEPGEDGFGGEGVTPDEDGNADVVWEPGTVAKLGPGEEIKFSEPDEVSGAYEAFMAQQLRGVAVATRTLYEQLTGDYSKINDRTWRAAVNEFRRSMEALQHNIVVYQLCRPVVRRWLDTALLAGLITLPAAMERPDIYHVKWLPQRWAYIHPQQDIAADKDEVRAGFVSRSQKVAERGYDAAAIDAEQASDNTRADGLGLRYDSDGRTKAAAPAGRAPGAFGRSAGDRPDDDRPDDDSEEDGDEDAR